MNTLNSVIAEFEITILRGDKSNQDEQQRVSSWPVVAKYKGKDGLINQREGTLKLSQEALEELTACGEDAESYGTILGKALFQDKVGTAFSTAFSISEFQLRFLLSIEVDDNDKLRRLHWERLCFPEDSAQEEWNLLALDRRVFYSLYISGWVQNLFHAFEQNDLQALVLVANPQSDNGKWPRLQQFDDQAAMNSVRKALGDIPCKFLTNIEAPDRLGPPTLDELSKQLTHADKPYTLLHLVCHGNLTKAGNVLYWATEENEVLPILEQELINRLKGLGGNKGLPHFTFLCACESAMPEAEDALGGLAQNLVRKLGMPAVVGMTRKITVTTALKFGANFYQQLRHSGYVDLALKEATAGLEGREDITVPTLFSRLRGRPLFFIPQEGKELNEQKIKEGLQKFSELLDKRAPNAEVLHESFQTQEKILRQSFEQQKPALPADDPNLTPEAAGKKLREKPLNELNYLCLQVLDLTFSELALGKSLPEHKEIECPFPGLSAFGKKDASGERQYQKFFFGREQLIKTLQEKLSKSNFLAVSGPSGCGKSSLILAGLLPRLEQDGFQSDDLTPGNEEPVKKLDAKIEQLSEAEQAVLVVDQFEELFTLCTKDDRTQFIDHLLAFAQKQKVVITIRGDFWAECAYHSGLKDRLNQNYLLIGPMEPEELGKAIQRQADAVGLRFETGLSNAILREVEQEPGIMPLLQYALQLLYERRRGSWLCRDEYEAIGGVQKAIATIADQVYEKLRKLGNGERVREIFQQLTRVEENETEGKPRDTRKRVKQDEIRLQAVEEDTRKALVNKLVNRLADARLVVISDGIVEVSHEALIREWKRLQNWLNENRAELKLNQQIEREAEEWQKHQQDNKPEDFLRLKGTLLDAGVVLKNKDKLKTDAQDYVEACVEWQEMVRAEKIRLQRRNITVLVGGLVATFIVAVVAIGQWQIAEKRSREARIALSGQLALQSSNTTIENYPQRALLLAIEALKVTLRENENPTLEAQKALQQSLKNIRGIPFSGHDGPVNVTISSDSKWIVTKDSSNVRMWKIATSDSNDGPLILPGGIKRVDFSPDRKWMVTVRDDGDLFLWDLTVEYPTAEPIKLEGFQGTISDIAISSDNRWIIVATSNDSPQDTFYVWDLKLEDFAVKPIDDFRVESISRYRNLRSIVFSPDSRWVVTNNRLWNLGIDKPFSKPLIFLSIDKSFSSINPTFSSDSRWLAIAHSQIRADDTIELWDLTSPQPSTNSRSFKISNYSDLIDSLAFSPESRWLVAGSIYGKIYIWDLQSEDSTAAPRVIEVDANVGRDRIALAIDESKYTASSHQWLFVASGSTARIWNLYDPSAEPLILRDSGSELPLSISNATISSNHHWLMTTSSSDFSIRLWNLNNSYPTQNPLVLKGHEGSIVSAAFSEDSDYRS